MVALIITAMGKTTEMTEVAEMEAVFIESAILLAYLIIILSLLLQAKFKLRRCLGKN